MDLGATLGDFGLEFEAIDFALLDMDGTLLDRRFDDFFWEEVLPDCYGEMHGLGSQASREELLARYRSREGSLSWTDIDFWSRELGLDIESLKEEHKNLIAVHPDVEEFLVFLKARGVETVLVTNAHPKVLALKLAHTPLEGYFDRMICSQALGVAKEQLMFWQRMESVLGKDYRTRSLLVDDTERILEIASDYGIRYPIFRWYGNSTRPAPRSNRFPSIGSFRELMEHGFRTR